MLHHALDELGPTEQETRLGAAQHFVSTGRDQIDARLQAVLDAWLRCQSVGRGFDQ